jgi:hypothetical protein
VARLELEAARGTTEPVYESQEPVALWASVIDDAGQPVEGLSKRHFTLDVLDGPMIGEEGPEALLPVFIDSVTPKGHGFYQVWIKPGAAGAPPEIAWGKDFITLGLAVERQRILDPHGLETDRGQTVIALEETSA